MVRPADVSAVSLANHSETWVDVIRDRAQHRPERVVYTFLGDGDARESRLTYQELVMGEVRSVEQEVASVDAVTAEDVRRVARTILDGPLQLAVIGPFAKTTTFLSAIG